jgi:tetratricopeptide (TPR) repeat protein
MPRYIGCLALLTLTSLAAGRLQAQHVAPDDPPKLLPSTTQSPKERDRRAALAAFVLGHICERQDGLLEALKAYQQSAELDPEPAAIYKAQLPLLIALERGKDALAAARNAVERDPDDYEVWAILGRLHKAMGHYAEARQAIEKGLHAPGLQERPELAQQMYFDLGGLYEADEKFAPAADAYTHAAQLLDHPDVIAEHAGVGKELVLQRAAEIYERIGDLYRKAKQYERAATAYRAAQQRVPLRGDRLHYSLAQVWAENGNDAKALDHLDAYLRSQPLGTDGYTMKIDVLRRLNREGDIVPWLEKAAKLDTYNVGLHLLLARECGRARQIGRAEQIYQTVAETTPSAELYRGLFRLYHDDAQTGPAKVLTVFDQTLAKAARKGEIDTLAAAQVKAMLGALREDDELGRAAVGGAFKAITKGAPLRFETMQVLAVLAEKNRQSAEAEKLYRACLKEMTPAAETMVYSGLIRVLAKARKFDAQLEVCDGALNGKPALGLPKAQATSQVLFLSEKARALAGMQRYDDAVDAADRAATIATDNNRLLVRHLRVRLLLMANRCKDAETDCLALLKQYSQPAEVLEIRYLLSNVYSSAKQYAKSEEQLQLVLQADPDNATANNDLGYLWADQNKNLVEAEQRIRKAIDTDRRQRQGVSAPALPGEPAIPQPIIPASAVDVEDNAAYVDSLGWVLYRRGQVEQARKELERAARLPDGEDPVIWEHLGDVYEHLKMPADARRTWEHALQLYEQGQRRRDEERLQDLQRKLKALPPAP